MHDVCLQPLDMPIRIVHDELPGRQRDADQFQQRIRKRADPEQGVSRQRCTPAGSGRC